MWARGVHYGGRLGRPSGETHAALMVGDWGVPMGTHNAFMVESRGPTPWLLLYRVHLNAISFPEHDVSMDLAILVGDIVHSAPF